MKTVSEKKWHNKELYALFKDTDISKHFKVNKLRCTELVMEKEDQDINKRMSYTHQELGREKCQDSSGWMKCIECLVLETCMR